MPRSRLDPLRTHTTDTIDVAQKLLADGVCRFNPIFVVVLHELFVGIGVRDTNAFHVGSAPPFWDDDVGAVSGRFGDTVKDFVSLDFKPIHHYCIDNG